jgi:hypothetical protein
MMPSLRSIKALITLTGYEGSMSSVLMFEASLVTTKICILSQKNSLTMFSRDSGAFFLLKNSKIRQNGMGKCQVF